MTGITEPLEFMFMFLAPMLYVFHAIMTGAAMVVCYMLGILHGFGFSAGLTDYLLCWGLASKPVLLIPIGLVFGAIYYVVFVWAIKKFDISTPGRYEEEVENVRLDNTDLGALAVAMLEKLGGKGNITSLEDCITRLRLNVKNSDVINEQEIKALGAHGLVKRGSSLQVIIGTKAELLANEMKKLLM